MAEIQRAAAAERRSAEDIVQEALERYLRQKRREALYLYGENRAEKLGVREEDVPELVRQMRREDRERRR